MAEIRTAHVAGSFVDQPKRKHTCEPPKHRPKSEWRTVAPPLGFMRPQDRAHAKPRPIPTSYPPGTVWLCACGRGWISHQGQHYGRNPNMGYGPDFWTPVAWWQRRIRRRINAHKEQADYEHAAAIVAAWKPVPTNA